MVMGARRDSEARLGLVPLLSPIDSDHPERDLTFD